jgi:hypothetical protein
LLWSLKAVSGALGAAKPPSYEVYLSQHGAIAKATKATKAREMCGTAAYCFSDSRSSYFYLIDIDFLCVRMQVCEGLIGGGYVRAEGDFTGCA